MKKKNFRKVANFATALVLTACMAAPMTSFTAFAAGENSITITADSSGLSHTDFEAYQIFTGTYNDADNNITITGWGTGINAAAFITAIKADATIGTDMNEVSTTADATSASKVADIIATWTGEENKTKREAFAKLAVKNKATDSGTYSGGTISGLDDGYYVVIDAVAATKNPTNESAWTLGLLHVAGGTNTEISPKTAYPTVIKKVKEDDNTTDGGYGAGYNDVADWDINTPVPFYIEAKVPSNIDSYNTYYMKFTDELDDTFNAPENVTVKVNGETISAYESNTSGNDMTVVIKDLKTAKNGIKAGDKVTIEYTAKLNPNANIGNTGQENKVALTYSNNPNVDVAFDTDGTTITNPGDSTGQTPWDEVVVFTYEIDIKKVDGATDKALAGAKFTLQNENDKYASVGADGKFLGWLDSTDNTTTLESAADGTFKIIGLDDGTYTLKETAAPDGYNISSKDFVVKIEADAAFTQDYNGEPSSALTSFTGSVDSVNDANASASTGIVSGTIENNKGSTLPSTGGIGTTIFYAAGGTVAAAAGVLLITKKRMKNRK